MSDRNLPEYLGGFGVREIQFLQAKKRIAPKLYRGLVIKVLNDLSFRNDSALYIIIIIIIIIIITIII
jgi:hypothetical protein